MSAASKPQIVHARHHDVVYFVGGKSVKNRLALPLADHHAGVSEQLQLVRNRGLVHFKHTGKVGDAHFAYRQRRQHAQSRPVGEQGENFRSLTDSEVEKYMQRFGEIEDISPEEVQANTGMTFYCW